MLKERKCVQVGRMQRQHIHFLSLPEHMTHKLASLKKTMEVYSLHWGPEVHSQDVDWALPPPEAPGKDLFLFWLR